MKTLIETSTDIAEIKAFSTAQNKTIIELSRRLKEKDDEIVHLKKLLEGSVPLVKAPTDLTQADGDDREYLCRIGLRQLKQISDERELTFEECRKLDIYSKILKDLMGGPKTIEVKSRNLSNDELLKLVSDDK